jgi:hypothetical protein
MDENNIKLDFSEIDKLLQKLADDKNFEQGDLFYDNNLITSAASASTISTVAGNTWPYTTGSYNFNMDSSSTNWQGNWQYGDPKLKVQGDAEFEGDVKIKGKSISETLDKIEARLGILHPNDKLEKKWEELKKLGDAYRALEKDIIEKEKIWDTLKK